MFQIILEFSTLMKIAYGEFWWGRIFFLFFWFFYMFLHLVLIYSGLFQKKAILGARTKMEICIVLDQNRPVSKKSHPGVKV